ncbi:LolA family protein [Geomesophilobacter sediminis]|uniref:Outer membrane lipoprotein carrier protein LolA n=1 Tax=Geomesophilobacter sediminis TaxID=2798584 RepID=A0A8J7S903_9BACT|nr:outer membrane lipoprotein carrier protein LolA [Geomesophilobacter sediminis]MBJ6727897.1 outer membrane lipoprotein carrier protein LolA [Geomesophilobacter sediminis]
MKLLKTLSLAVSLFAFAATSAFAADLNQVVKTLEEGYGTLNDVQAAFSQKTTISSVKREQKGGGELYIKKGSGSNALFRFNYDRPKQQIVSNGKQVWYYLPENKQVMVMSMAQLFEGGKSVALNYLTGMGHVSRDFNAKFAAEQKDKKGNYIIELTPKQKNPAIAKLQLTISGDAVEKFVAHGRPSYPFPIVSSVMTDQVGNITRIEYSNVKTNKGISSSKFEFKVPSGVEVIKR